MKQQTTEELIDIVTCLLATNGLALHLTETLERDYKKIWTYKTKQTGKAFIEQLEKSVNLIWQLGNKEDLTTELSNQQANTYELCENMLRIAMRAEKTLTPEARQIFESEFVELIKKYNLAL